MPEFDRYAEAFQERLKQLAGDSSQREFARKLGITHTYVGRYLKGGGAPATFCYLLVDKLGVNPVWLLTGEGAPFVTDMAIENSQMAGDILELVKAMESVTKMRLGALSGKRHLEVLRELNDALARHEELRERLNRQSRDIFRQILVELEKHLKNAELDKAEPLLKAANQISRLSDDAALKRSLGSLNAQYHYVSGDFDQAAAALTPVIVNYAASGAAITEELSTYANRLVATLMQSLRLQDAKRLLDAMLALAGREGRVWPALHTLRAQAGLIDIEQGRLQRGRRLLLDAQERVSPYDQERITGPLIAYMLMLEGTVSIEALARFDLPSFVINPYLAQGALWREEQPALETMARWLETESSATWWKLELMRLYVTSLLSALRDRDAQVLRDFDISLDKIRGNGAVTEFERHTHLIVKTRLAHRLGKSALARQCFQEAENVLSSSRPQHLAPVLFRALHHRSALELGGNGKSERAAVRRAKAFFSRYSRTGYGCFAKVLTLELPLARE